MFSVFIHTMPGFMTLNFSAISFYIYNMIMIQYDIYNNDVCLKLEIILGLGDTIQPRPPDTIEGAKKKRLLNVVNNSRCLGSRQRGRK